MGDTFPQTFSCLDLRIRTSDNHTTFVQEIGRMCRYPACNTSSDCMQVPITVSSEGVNDHTGRLVWLEKALKFSYRGGVYMLLEHHTIYACICALNPVTLYCICFLCNVPTL